MSTLERYSRDLLYVAKNQGVVIRVSCETISKNCAVSKLYKDAVYSSKVSIRVLHLSKLVNSPGQFFPKSNRVLLKDLTRAIWSHFSKVWAVFTKFWGQYERKTTIIKRFLSQLFTSFVCSCLRKEYIWGILGRGTQLQRLKKSCQGHDVFIRIL